jgi:hypothetical protein
MTTMTIIDAIATDAMIVNDRVTGITTDTGGTTVMIGAMNATVIASGVAIATIATMTGATVGGAIETSRSDNATWDQADCLCSRGRPGGLQRFG